MGDREEAACQGIHVEGLVLAGQSQVHEQRSDAGALQKVGHLGVPRTRVSATAAMGEYDHSVRTSRDHEVPGQRDAMDIDVDICVGCRSSFSVGRQRMTLESCGHFFIGHLLETHVVLPDRGE